MNTQLPGPSHARRRTGRPSTGRTLLAVTVSGLLALTGFSHAALADEPGSGAIASGGAQTESRLAAAEAESLAPQAEADDSTSATVPATSGAATSPAVADQPEEESASSDQEHSALLGRAAAASPFTCTPGVFYTLNAAGQVYRITSNSEGLPNKTVVSSGLDFGDGEFNGLAVGNQGSVGYAFDRGIVSGSGASQTHNVKVYETTSVGTVTAVTGSTELNKLGGGRYDASGLIAGGVSPTDPTGSYYFGGYEIAQTSERPTRWAVYFHLWKMDATSHAVSYVGRITAQQNQSSKPAGGNGDLAFSAAGDLYVLWSDGQSKARIIPVTAGSLAAANGGVIPDQQTSTLTDLQAGQINGIAFDNRGRVLVQTSSEGTTTVRLMDPDTGTTIPGSATGLSGMSGAGVDLASCNTPPTLELHKNVVDRSASGDQFELQIIRDGQSSGSLATTKGDLLGLQADYAGPVIAVAGGTYHLIESGVGTADTALTSYTTSFQCVNTAQNNAVVAATRLSDHEYTLTVPDAGTAVVAIACTFTNTPAKGSAEWSKTDGATPGNLLAGSEWTLKGPSYPTGVTVVDNGDLDVDKTNGRFRIDNLQYGSYTLTENKAPTGFVPDTQVHTFTVTAADNGIVQVGAIKNVPVKGSVKWTKVGDGGRDDLLAGTTWTLTPTDPAGQPITVVDNQGRDADPADGHFLVNDLPYGKYTISEASAPEGFELNTGSFPFTISENGATVTVNDGEPIVNKRTLGSVTWKKSDEDGNALAGSEWQLTGPDGTSTPVVDNQAPDDDPADGAFRVEGLTWGNYTLVETKAPAGYQRLDTEFSFTIDGTHLQAVVNEGHAIVNKQQVPPSLPLTGGLGTDTFLLAGGGLLALAGVGGFIHRRRSLQLRNA